MKFIIRKLAGINYLGDQAIKNQYVGDIGDYTKLALLRVIENAGFSIGVNWYLTLDDADSKDGRHIEYLDSPCDTPDKDLHDAFFNIVKIRQSRTIESLMDSGLLKSTMFFDEVLDFTSDTNRWQKRYEWHKKALIALSPASVVFLDPDNGLIPDSIGPYTIKGNKYATYEEAAEYYNGNKSIIIYNHRDMSPIEKYVSRLNPTILCNVL